MQDTDKVPEAAGDAAPVTEYDQAWDDFDAEDAAGSAAPDQEIEPEDDVVPEDRQDDPEPAPEPDKTEEPKAQTEDITALEHKYRSEMGRYKGHWERAQSLAKELEALRGRQKAPAEDEDDRLKAAEEEYGDVVAPLAHEIRDLRAQVRKGREDDMTARETSAQQELMAIEERENAVFEEAHADGFAVLHKHRDVFTQWIQDQPKVYRDAFERNMDALVDGQGAALLVSRFKHDLAAAQAADAAPPAQTEQPQNTIAERRRRQLRGARDVAQKSRGATSVEPAPSDDYDREWEYWDRKDKQK